MQESYASCTDEKAVESEGLAQVQDEFHFAIRASWPMR